MLLANPSPPAPSQAAQPHSPLEPNAALFWLLLTQTSLSWILLLGVKPGPWSMLGAVTQGPLSPSVAAPWSPVPGVCPPATAVPGPSGSCQPARAGRERLGPEWRDTMGQQMAPVLTPTAHLVLGHHVSPMQDQHFDDLIAAEPCGIMQRRVTFL